MSTLVLPSFIEEQTNNHSLAAVTSGINMDNIKSFKEVTQFLKTFMDKTQANILLNDQGKFKKNVMIIYNEELLPHENIDETEIERDSTVELMVQFAGG